MYGLFMVEFYNFFRITCLDLTALRVKEVRPRKQMYFTEV